MRRLTTVLLGLALIAGSGRLSTLHVHSYTDHEHQEHHHGPAAHEHQVATDDAEGGVHFERCDPGQHLLPIRVFCSASPHVQTVDAEFITLAPAAPALQLHQTVDITDVRVHGPPARSQGPPRAPPLNSRLII